MLGLFARNRTKNQKLQTGVPRNKEKFYTCFYVAQITNCTGFKLIYHSTQSNQKLWHLILRGKQKETRLLVSGRSPECSDCLLRFMEQQ